MKWRIGRIITIAVALAALLMGEGVLGSTALAESPRQNIATVRRTAGAPPIASQLPGVIKGVVFQDWTQDGVRDPFEPALAGATVVLMDRTGRELDVQVTSHDGAFHFAGLAPATYRLTEIDPAGYSSLGPDEALVVLGSGETSQAAFGDILLLRASNP